MVAILLLSTKLATSDFLKRKIFRNKGYDVKNFGYDITNNILSHDSNYTVKLVMWQKFGNSSISLREGIINSIL